MKGSAFVQESLSLNQALLRREDEIVGNTVESGLSTRKGQPKPLSGAGIERSAGLVWLADRTPPTCPTLSVHT